MLKKPISRNRWRAVALVLCFSLLTIIGIADKNSAQDNPYEKLKIFTDILKIVENNYVEEVDQEELYNGAIWGMLRNLDSHSSYMIPDAYKEMQVETKGSFGGLGIEITIKNNRLTVVSPIEGTPAYQAGIKSGDWIVKVDGDSTKDMSLMDAVKKIRGPKGAEIIISVMRKGFNRPKDFKIIREVIQIKNITSEMFENGIGYIKIRQFQERSAEELDEALSKLQEDNMQALILDLRNNPGGLLDMAISVADRFLEKDKLIVSTKGRSLNQNKEYKAQLDLDETYPMVVMVNSGSASAAEIVAGAIKDHGRGVILGTRSFGKGSVQTVIQLSDGSGLRLTTAYYYTPNGTNIHAKGIEPDVTVEEYAMITNKKEYTIREKDLRQFKGNNHHEDLKPEENTDDEEIIDEDYSIDEPEEDATEDDKVKTEEKTDFQLTRSIEILKANLIFQSRK